MSEIDSGIDTGSECGNSDDTDVGTIKKPIKMIQIRKGYRVILPDGTIKGYDKLKDIATEYNTAISNVYKLSEGGKVKALDFMVEKEFFPYVWRFKGDKILHQS